MDQNNAINNNDRSFDGNWQLDTIRLGKGNIDNSYGQSLEHHSEHFIVNYSEVETFCGPAEVGVTLLIVYYFDVTL